MSDFLALVNTLKAKGTMVYAHALGTLLCAGYGFLLDYMNMPCIHVAYEPPALFANQLSARPLC